MEKVKRVFIIILLFLTFNIFLINKVYADVGGSLNFNVPSSGVNAGEEFNVDFSLNNVQGENGVIRISGILAYDKSALTLVSTTGEGEWTVSLDKETGNFAVNRNGYTKSNEKFMKIVFRVNSRTTQKATITVNSIEVSDGETKTKSTNISKTVNIKEKAPQTPTPNTNTNTNTNNNTNTNTNTNQASNNQSNNTNTMQNITNEDVNQLIRPNDENITSPSPTTNPQKTPQYTVTPILGDDYMDEKGQKKLSKVDEENGNNTIIYILSGVALAIVLIIIILMGYLKIRYKNNG